jgi:hypothetical protein
MLLRKLFIVACCILLWANFTHAQVNRPYEPIVLTGDTLSQFLNQEIQYLYVYAYDASLDSWQMIPFQIDEVNPHDQDSVYFKPDSSFGLLDADDELVFLLNDLGDQADSTSWLEGADSVRYEISLFDSLTNQMGYVYLYSSQTISDPVPGKYAMAYDDLNDRVMSANYEVGFNYTGQLADVAIKSGSGTDIFDRLKIRAIGSWWILPIFLWEDNVEMFYAYAKVGPVRVIRNMYGRFVYDVLNFDEKFTQTAFFYPWNGSFKLFEIPISEAADFGADVDVVRVSWDFNNNATGMNFYSENNRSGILIDGDGSNDNIDPACFPGQLNWTMGTGEPGTILNVFHVPPLGDSIHIYYHEATDGSTGDNAGLKIDSGDSLSFADNGFSLEQNVEKYAKAESTLNVIYYNFFLPPNFDPDEASLICEQLKSPLKYYTQLQKFTLPSVVSKNDQFTPIKFKLEQNYPNPFNSATTISFSLPKRTEVSLRIYDTLGRLIYTVVDQNLSQGFHKFIWDGQNNEAMPVPSGVYFYRIETPEFNSTKKLIFIK